MASNDIEQRIVLKGEKEYKSAIKEAQRNLKTLRSELKAETAELGANATAQEKNAAKIKSLQKQIKEQEKIVKANKDALAEVKEKYSDNAEAIAKYEQKLNESRTALANMKNELDRVGEGFKGVEVNAAQATVATKSVADALGNIGDIGESVSSAIESVFMGLMSNVRDVCLEIWDLISETAAKADRWGDLAGFYGSSAEEVQLIDRAISETGADIEDFISLMNQLQFKGKDKDLIDWLGLSSVNYDNEVQYAFEALALLNEKKEQLGTGKFNKQLGEVFGNKSAGLLELIDKYPAIIDKIYKLKEHKGYLLDEDELKTMSQVQAEIKSIETKWDELRTKIGAGFGTVTLKLTASATGVLDSLADYLSATTEGERKEALTNLEKNLTDIFVTLGDAITDGIKVLDKVASELQTSDNVIVKGLGTALSAIVDILEWLTVDNANNFRTALIIIAGAWGASEVMKMVATIGELAGNLATLKTARTLQSLSNILSGGGGMSAAGSAAGAAWGGAFASAVLKAAPWLLGLYTLLNPSSTSDDLGNNELVKDGKVTKEGEKLGYRLDETGDLVRDIDEIDPQHMSKSYRLWLEDQKTEQEMNKPQQMTAEQWAVAQKWWDEIERGKHGEFTDEEWDEFEKAFAGNEEVFDKLIDMIDYLKQSNEETNGKNTWESIEDLPAEWWQTQGGNSGNTDGLTGQDAKTITQAINGMPSAVTKGMSGVKVYMDRTVVGNLVADQVSQQIAAMVH